jgi:uncharacterized protein (TIGR02594 family)
MTFKKTSAAALLCGVALAALAGTASAKPLHHHRGHAAAAQIAATGAADTSNTDPRYPGLARQQATVATAGRSRQSAANTVADAPVSAIGLIGSNSLIADARKYIGTNPTGRGSLWCGAFMDMVLKETGHVGGGNLATGYAHYGTRVDGPQVGAIAVMGRRGGGHVGIVTGVDASGNPIILSGNHNHTVAESTYPRGRIFAYVLPKG